MTLLIIKCQICDESIASAESAGLSVPLNGTMFGPPFPERMKHSLLTEASFEYLRCPTCSHNPFLRNDEVLTTDGIYRIESNVSCECCDPPREFKSKSGLSSHIRAKEREANKDDR